MHWVNRSDCKMKSMKLPEGETWIREFQNERLLDLVPGALVWMNQKRAGDVGYEQNRLTQFMVTWPSNKFRTSQDGFVEHGIQIHISNGWISLMRFIRDGDSSALYRIVDQEAADGHSVQEVVKPELRVVGRGSG